MFKERQYIDGASGKGGGGGGSNASDTLVTDEKVLILHSLGEGEINLFTGDGKSIFLNNIPLQNSDGSYNFGAYNQVTGDTGLYTGGGSTYWETRNGSPSQSPMTNPAFPSASTVVPVNQEAFGGTTVPLVAPAPVIYSVSSALVDYVLVNVEFPNGIQTVDSGGNIVGDSVEIQLAVKPHTSSTWVTIVDTTLNYKASQAADIQYKLDNPSPGALWDVRLSRITVDNSTATRSNQTFLKEVEEVQQIVLPYNGIALVGLALDAATIGGTNASIPTMSFLVSKGPIQIPSNYNPATNTFTDIWSGTFTTGVTDDPAWILYDMLTNPKYGAALYGITTAMVDKFSFYNASVFNNAQVDDGKGMGTTEARFTFNAPIQNRQDMYQTFQQVAGMMNACIVMVNGLITIFQDRPTDASYLVTKANVLQSDATSPTYFKYSSTALTDRITTVQVTYVNSLDVAWLPTTTSVQDSIGLARYGYQVYDLSAFGSTTEGQAMRAGRYYMFTTLYNTETVDYDTGIEGFNSNLYDVIDVFDDDYAGAAMGGRIVSATANTVTVDQPITISGAVSKIGVKLQDGVTYETHTITNAPGTYTTFNLSGVWSVTPTKYCTYGVTSAITPRQFRIVDLRYDNVTKVVSVTAQLYNKNNYAYVESGYAIQAGVYTQFVQTAPLAPTSLVATPSQYIDTTTNTVAYAVTVSWDRPASQNVSYKIRYRKDNAAYVDTPQFTGNSYDLTHTQNGTYQFLVYSYNVAGNASAPATISYTQNNTGGGASATLAEITNLTVQGGGTAWTGTDLNFTFTNPTANQGLLKDFVVTLKTTGGTLLRSVTVPGVAGGQAQGFIYTYQMNNDDTAGVPNRSIVVKVQGQDSSNNTTTGITATLTNAAPPVPSNIASSPGQQSAIISWTPETGVDIAGYIVWSSTTSAFTPSSGNAIDCGMTALASINGLAKSTNYFYRVAAYDIFGKSLAGTGLNVSSQLSFTTPSSVGVSSGSTLPVSGMVAGDTFFLTTTSTLYKYTGTAWVAVGVQEGSTLPGTGNVGDVFFLTTDNKLYRYTGTAWIKAVDGADITANSILANSVVTGTLTSAQIAASTILGSNIVGGTITGSLIAAATITGGNIVASTITAGLLNVSTLSAITANLGTLTAGLISNNSGTNTINLSATGATAFISTPGLTITAAGTATFSGILSGAIVTAANCSIGTLSAINANVGTLTGGLLTNNSGTNTINLSATGATPFINAPNFTLTAAGSATFSGALSAASGTFSGTLTAGAINAVNTINIAGNAVTSLATANQVGTFGFIATASVAAFYDNTSCSVTFTLASAATIVITAIVETDLFDGSVWTLGAWNTGALGLADIGIGSGDTSAIGYVKVDSTYMTNTQGTFTVALAAGSHTVKVASHVDTTTSGVATTARMVNGQVIVQWAYR